MLPEPPGQRRLLRRTSTGCGSAFVIAAGLVAYFLTRVRRALDERGREIARLRRQAEEGARFAALGTLAAGTAHELATPLGTIAVLAGELDGAARRGDGARAAIAAQVARCRDIITRMQAGAAAPARAGEDARRRGGRGRPSRLAAGAPRAAVAVSVRAPEGG